MYNVMKNIKKQFQYTLLALVAMLSIGAAPLMSTVSAAGPTTTVAAVCKQRVFGFPTWYNGVVDPSSCELNINELNDFWIIVMNVVEILLITVAYVSAGYVLWGGFKYIKSEGDPGKISEAKMAIMNAIFGIVIAMGSVAIVQFIQSRIVQ